MLEFGAEVELRLNELTYKISKLNLELACIDIEGLMYMEDAGNATNGASTTNGAGETSNKSTLYDKAWYVKVYDTIKKWIKYIYDQVVTIAEKIFDKVDKWINEYKASDERYKAVKVSIYKLDPHLQNILADFKSIDFDKLENGFIDLSTKTEIMSYGDALKNMITYRRFSKQLKSLISTIDGVIDDIQKELKKPNLTDDKKKECDKRLKQIKEIGSTINTLNKQILANMENINKARHEYSKSTWVKK